MPEQTVLMRPDCVLMQAPIIIIIVSYAGFHKIYTKSGLRLEKSRPFPLRDIIDRLDRAFKYLTS